MGIFDFFGKKNEFNITFRCDRKLFLKDVVVGDKIKLWKPKGEIFINYYDKAIDERIGFKDNKKIAQFIDEKIDYVAYVKKISGFDFTVKIIFEWEDIDLKSFAIPLPKNYASLDKERHERIQKRFEEQRRLAKEKRALVQPQYDKVLNTHQKKLEEFSSKFEALKDSNDIKKLEKLLGPIQKELERIEAKEDKRNDVFYDRSEKWQDSEKGILYENITDELTNIFNEIEDIKEEIEKLIKN